MKLLNIRMRIFHKVIFDNAPNNVFGLFVLRERLFFRRPSE